MSPTSLFNKILIFFLPKNRAQEPVVINALFHSPKKKSVLLLLLTLHGALSTMVLHQSKDLLPLSQHLIPCCLLHHRIPFILHLLPSLSSKQASSLRSSFLTTVMTTFPSPFITSPSSSASIFLPLMSMCPIEVGWILFRFHTRTHVVSYQHGCLRGNRDPH